MTVSADSGPAIGTYSHPRFRLSALALTGHLSGVSVYRMFNWIITGDEINSIRYVPMSYTFEGQPNESFLTAC